MRKYIIARKQTDLAINLSTRSIIIAPYSSSLTAPAANANEDANYLAYKLKT